MMCIHCRSTVVAHSVCGSCKSVRAVAYNRLNKVRLDAFRARNRATQRLAQIADDLEQPGLDALDIRELEAHRMLATVMLERALKTLNEVSPVPLSSVNPSVVQPVAKPVPKAVPKAKPPASKATGLSCPPVSRYGTPLTDAERAYIAAGGTITRRFGVMGS